VEGGDRIKLMEFKDVVVFITTQTEEEAKRIGDLLLQGKKAFCVNVIPRVHSLFWWKGKIDSAQESLLIVKTKASLLKEVRIG